MREVEVFDMNGVNIAEGKPAIQSNTLNNNKVWRPQSGNDGKLSTYQSTNNSESKLLYDIVFFVILQQANMVSTCFFHTRSLVGGRSWHKYSN